MQFDFPKWKVWLSLLVTIVLVVSAIPNFFAAETVAKWPNWLPHQQLNLGLDLSGGSHLLLEADVKDVTKQKLEKMQADIGTAIRRADPALGAGDVTTDNSQISFFVRNVKDIDRARELAYKQTSGVGVTGQRDWNVEVRDSTRVVMTPTAAGLADTVNNTIETARSVVAKRIDPDGTKEVTVVRQGASRILVEVPGLQDPAGLKALLGKTAKLEFRMVDPLADPAQIARGEAPPGDQLLPYPDGREGMLAVSRRVAVSGDELTKASPGQGQNNQPIVNFSFNSNGALKFARITQDNVGKRFAVILDNVIITAPVINTPILGGSGYIEGNFTPKSASDLAIQLQSGALPVALKVVEERTVGPELGADSIHRGIIAGGVAMVLLAIFMIITYFRFGVYTTIALVINAFMILGVMALIGATLTLPGIAGFILTLGAAVDANVLINERIREEVKRGRRTLQAIEFGYKEASRAIFDANFTNVISAAIMGSLGTGPIRGFAVVLFIGVCTSVFCGVTLSRLMVADWFRRTRPTTINM
jgi:preprotein translocase subunit SecD